MLTELQAGIVRGVRGFEEIGHALARVCRFGGRMPGFYPVLAHTFVVEELVEPRYRLDALLHDAQEVYCGDVPRPFKPPGYDEHERRLRDLLMSALGVPCRPPAPELAAWRAVKVADDQAVGAERIVLDPANPEDWLAAPPPETTSQALRATRRWAHVPLSMWLDGSAEALYATHCREALAAIAQTADADTQIIDGQ